MVKMAQNLIDQQQLKHTQAFLKKIFLPFFLEDLAFCIKRAEWKVTKIYSRLTFEQARLKRKFMLMNQKSSQQSKNYTEKAFYKPMNNSNFGYDCRNNLHIVSLCPFLMN